MSNVSALTSASQLERGVGTVVPATSSVQRIYPFQVLPPPVATGMSHDSKAQAEQIRSVAVQRHRPQIGTVPPGIMDAVDEALRVHLAL